MILAVSASAAPGTIAARRSATIWRRDSFRRDSDVIGAPLPRAWVVAAGSCAPSPAAHAMPDLGADERGACQASAREVSVPEVSDRTHPVDVRSRGELPRRSESSGELEEPDEVVPHDVALDVLGLTLELVDIRHGVGQALGVGEVGTEDEAVGADDLEHAGDVLLRVRRHHEVFLEDLAR